MRLFAVAVLLVATAACSAPPETVAREDGDMPLTARSVAEGVDPDAARQAVEVALRDERLEGLLASHAHHVAEVAELMGSGQWGLVVTVEFEQPLGDDADHPQTCAPSTPMESPITGVVCSRGRRGAPPASGRRSDRQCNVASGRRDPVFAVPPERDPGRPITDCPN
jgi:hypothetical protein